MTDILYSKTPRIGGMCLLHLRLCEMIKIHADCFNYNNLCKVWIIYKATSTASFENEDVEIVCQMERESYWTDEAGSPTHMRYRLKEAGELFLGYEIDGQLIAFIGSIRSDSPVTIPESIYVHSPNGTTLYIYSVCVKSQFRR